MDDIDFTFRASKKYPLAIDPKVKGYHRGGMVALYNMRGDHERRVSGEWYFFGKNIEKTLPNILFFAWRLLGSLLVSLAVSLRHNTVDPIRGFLTGMENGTILYRRFSRRTTNNKKGPSSKELDRETPIRVLQIITRLIPGGAADITLNLCRGLKEKGLQVELAGLLDPKMAETVRKTGIPLHHIPEFRREVSPLYDSWALLRLYRLINRGGYQIVHTHTSKAGILGRLAARLAHTPVILHTPHGSIFHPTFFSPSKQRFFTLIERLATPWTDRLVPYSQSEVRDYLNCRIAPPKKYSVVPAAFDLDRFNPQKVNIAEKKRELGLPEDSFVIGMIARLSPEKGHSAALEAFQKVHKEIPNALLLMVGDGELREEIYQRVTRMGLENRVIMTGYRGDIPEITPILDVSFVPSLWDCSPRSILEAMVCMVPVIATAVGGIPEIITNEETGLLAPSEDTEAMAQCILRLYRDKGLRKRLSARAAEEVQELFGPSQTIERMIQLYWELLAEKGFSGVTPQTHAC